MYLFLMTRRTDPPIKTRADKVLGQIHDPEVYSIGVIDEEHLLIHKGLRYTYSNYDTSVDTPSGMKFVLFATGSEYRVHSTWSAEISAQAATVTIHETGNIPNTGSRIYGVNRKRESSNVHGAILYSDPVVFRSGTLLHSEYVPAGNKLNAVAGERDEWYMAPNTYYLMNIRPEVDGAIVSVKFEWYEEQE